MNGWKGLFSPHTFHNGFRKERVENCLYVMKEGVVCVLAGIYALMYEFLWTVRFQGWQYLLEHHVSLVMVCLDSEALNPPLKKPSKPQKRDKAHRHTILTMYISKMPKSQRRIWYEIWYPVMIALSDAFMSVCDKSWGMWNHVMIIFSPPAPSPREQFSCSSYYLVTLLLLHYCYNVALCVGHLGTWSHIPLIEDITVMEKCQAQLQMGTLV